MLLHVRINIDSDSSSHTWCDTFATLCQKSAEIQLFSAAGEVSSQILG